jgi:hypothetical protein
MLNFFDRFNPWCIIKAHFQTLTDDRRNKVSLMECIFTLLLPICISFLMVVVCQIKLKTASINLIGNIMTAFSIFTGLLFNVLVLIYSLIKPNESNQQRIKVLKQTFSNVSFGVLLSLLLVILSMFYELINNVFLDGIIYFLVTLFLMVLFMILKRVYLLINIEFH